MTQHPHEPAELEPDPAVAPRPEETVADALREEPTQTGTERPQDEPAAGGDADGPPVQGEGQPDSH